MRGGKKLTVPAGQQERIPLSFALPADLTPGSYQLTLTANFSTGETQEDTFCRSMFWRPRSRPS